ncbi:MAG: LysR family transcriptional regulator [Byssovorax sp.]
MDHEDLRMLLLAVDCGSIQAAARQLGIARSLLRRRIDALESEVGAPLLHRSAGGVHLTAAGGIVIAHARGLVEGTRAMLAEARAAEGEATGTIRSFEPIGMPLQMRVSTLLMTHSAVPKLRFVARQVEDPLAHIDEPCELIFHEGDAPGGTWYSRVVRRLPIRVLASTSYLRARGTPQHLTDLAGHDILGWARPRHRADAWPLLTGGVVEVSPWLVSPDLFLIQNIAAGGGGLMFGPHVPFLPEPPVDALVPVLEGLVGDEILMRVSTPHRAQADPRTRRTIEQIQKLLDSVPDV